MSWLENVRAYRATAPIEMEDDITDLLEQEALGELPLPPLSEAYWTYREAIERLPAARKGEALGTLEKLHRLVG